MVIPAITAATGAARRALRCRTEGIWHAITATIEGRNAVNFERERRLTLLNVPQALPPGTEVYDRRADGGIWVLRVPEAARVDSLPAGNSPVIRPSGRSLPSNRRMAARLE